MQDLDFHPPAEKSPPSHDTVPCGRSKLAVVSLVFGILGLTVLPLLGSLIAIVTGLTALGEIRASGGRLGGRAMAKAGLWLGLVWVLLAIAVTAIFALFFGLRAEPHMTILPTTPSAPAPNRHASGVKMANELATFDLAQLQRLGVGDEDESGELICYYANDNPEDGEPESAALTSKQIVFMKGQRKTAFELKEIDELMDSAAYRQKYTPNYMDTSRYIIGVKRRSGARMRIVIRPYDDGPPFFHALEEAWKAAGGKPADKPAP